MDRAVAVAELKHRGIVPQQCVDGHRYDHDPHFDDEDGEDGTPMWVWKEPIPGPYTHGPARYDGVNLYNEYGIPHYDHGGCMVEIHRRSDIEFHLTRVLFSQPYGPRDRLDATVEEVRERLDLEMTVVDDLAWYHPSTTLCVYTPVFQMPFSDFRRTFRYWIITNVAPGTEFRAFEFKNGVIPTGVTPPGSIFFDIIQCGDRASVELGLRDETASEVWNVLPSQEFVTHDTFACLWGAYRWSQYSTPVLVILFVSKLRVRVNDRASYAPGGETHLRLVSEWSTLFGHT